MAVTPVTGNHCIGTHEDGTPNLKMLCLKGLNEDNEPVYTCATYRLFKVNCPKVNFLCSNRSVAYVAAITVCNQRLF